MANYVQEYRSTDLNATPLSGQTYTGIHLLKCCLKDGYGWTGMAITGITRTSNTATATVSTADGKKLRTGNILTITGADQSDYNITATITVASATTFTYTVANTPTTPATGTITCDNFLRITSITRGGTGNLTATATLSQANTSLVTGNYLTISGCSGTGSAQYNGTFMITRVSPTSFTYIMSADPTASASGSPVYCKAGTQWTTPFAEGTNSIVFRSADTDSDQHYLQVIDNGATAGGALEMQAYGAEVMSADQTVDNGGGANSGRFPTVAQSTNGICWRKSNTANTTIVEWSLHADDRTIYFYPISFAGGTTASTCAFGHFISVKAGDAYRTFIGGEVTFNDGYFQNCAIPAMALFTSTPTAAGGIFIARSNTQSGSSIPALIAGLATTNGPLGGSAFITFPNPSDSGQYTQSLNIIDAVSSLRGRLPGLLAPLHVRPNNAGDIVENINGFPGHSFRATNLGIYIGGLLTAQCLVDRFGPWD